MKDVISKIDYYLNIAEKLSTDVYSFDFSYFQKTILEQYKLGEFILLKTLGTLGCDVSEYSLPDMKNALCNNPECEWFKTIKSFSKVNSKLIETVLSSLGWNVNCYEAVDEDILDSCEYDDDGIVCFYAEEVLGDLAANLPYLMENIYEVASENDYSLLKYYEMSNKRIGNYLSKQQSEHTEITIAIERCINLLNTLFLNTYCIDSALLDNGLFIIGYFFFDDHSNGDGIDEENYNMSFLIICCLLNILLDELEK